ncbi:hypothetical protein ACFOGJ_13565 [Marinibaculum pumilum]|uniref:Uncharacterized protein n=1 Tax=Marinibaculum pumilum TaxID=1766165 RepID=A0ABV7L0S8_9PROT
MGHGSSTGRTGLGGLAAALALLCLDSEAMAEAASLRIDNATDLTLQMPADAEAQGNCTWGGPATMLLPGESATFTIAPADGGSVLSPCHLSVEVPIEPPPPVGQSPARLDLDIRAPTAGRLTVEVQYSFRLGPGTGHWAREPVVMQELQADAGNTYQLDLAPLAHWITNYLTRD